MAFLSPLFWLAAVTLAVPLLLHLTRREVRQPILFPSLMFLRRVPFQETRRRQIRNWLLLLLRCLLILMLIAAFARPVSDRFLAAVSPAATRSTVILLDRSLSMNRNGIWDTAVAEALQAARELQEGDEVSLVAFGDHAEVVVQWERRSDPIRIALEGTLSPGFGGTSYAEGLRQALSQLETASGDRKRIVLVTDLQSRGLDLDRLREEPVAGVELELRDVGRPDLNRFVEHLAVSREIFGTRASLTVRVAFHGEGADAAGPAEVRVYLNDSLTTRREISDWTDSRVATLSFEDLEVPEGITRGRVELHPSDALPADDVRFFVLERSAPFPVFMLSRTGEQTGFFDEALASGANLPFQVRRISSLAQVEPSARVVLVEDDVLQLDDGRLVPVLERGGGIVVTAGNGARAGIEAARSPAVLVEKRFTSAGSGAFHSLTEFNRDHPIFEPFSRSRRDLLGTVQFYGYWQVAPRDGANVLGRLGNGDPLLLERQEGPGRVLLFASSLDRVWSDFPLRGAYLPFWQSLIQYASGWAPKPAEHQIGTALSLAAWHGPGARRDGWDVLDPQGRRLAALGEEAPAAIEPDRPGFYELRYEKRTDWIAVNPDPSESDLARITEGEFQAAFRQISARQRQAARVGDPAPTSTDPSPIWWLFLIAACGILFIETIIANRTVAPARSAAKEGQT